VKKWLYFFCLAWMVSAGVASANATTFQCDSKALIADAEVASLIDAVEKRYHTVQDLSAQFQQTSYFAGLDRTQSSKGKVYFKSPGMMDWQYEEPTKQRFVSDGTTVWFYEPDEQAPQVTIADFKKSFSSEVPVSFLLGIGSLKKDFTIKTACRNTGEILMQLSPKKPDPNLSKFFLFVRSSDHSITGARIVDAGGNETTILLSDRKFNIKLKSARFSFSIPRGTFIVDNRKHSFLHKPLEELNLLKTVGGGSDNDGPAVHE